jgi:hypothetical protein
MAVSSSGEKKSEDQKKKSTSVGSAVSAVWVAYQVFDVLPDQADIPGGGSKLSTFFFSFSGMMIVLISRISIPNVGSRNL